MGRKVTDISEATDVYITGSICLTDIPKELITVAKNGKKYLRVVISKRRDLAQWGDSHEIKAPTSKDQKKDGVYDKSIGGGIQWLNDDIQAPTPTNTNAPAASAGSDDLPW